MDRQSILEQKRKRLEELRQRRLANNDEKYADNAVKEEAISKVIRVDASVQTQSDSPFRSNATSTINSLEITKFDKAVQTVNSTPNHPVQTSLIEVKDATQKESLDSILLDLNVNEKDLHSSLKSAVTLLHEVLATSIEPSVDSPAIQTDEEKGLIFVTTEVHAIKNRVPISIEVSTTPNEFLVNFNNNELEEFPGFAVIYRNLNGKVIPMKFLASLSPINCIKFDEFSPSKVIGGLTNGRVVIWELAESSGEDAVILPTLMSPSDYSNGNLHKVPITSISQISTEPNTFITTCLEGLINVWSTNFLEYPQFEGVSLPNNTEESLGILEQPFKSIKHAILLENGDKNVLKDHKFLNSMIISTETHGVHQLINDSKLGYIKSTIETKIVGSMTNIGYKDDSSLTALTCYDSNIYILNNHKKILKIATDYMVLGLFKRPTTQFQFVTFGLFDELEDKLTTVIDFWDLNVNTRSPLFSLRRPSSNHPTSGNFEKEGNIFYMGSSDGILSVLILDTNFITKGNNNDTIHEIV
ncbi:hypothetical protein PSN45_001240 [Yamadazyma tenuis]|uniref:WD40 repeat-like protein n=1 Tax=Candida tenuis (strain ATCC 10573 / BCRC 21748 / CBS 615 / JCM 9827 / NBRC 10315 / NRRL Y-1498 / VKM Y-70) TaxID=590646 RepID=G3B9D0_CANTC|nr:uncharacterized protein CANTEDRAFT_136418 [Yamadazyma tenuis ATCC 10573]EGV62475.1 hypothetical protein CANTEDRAFT_136418 [Yamadazyma tenuis ATCC 10573]WEJ93766.1 hypothetical protein PSN45_001240 [Yamadazyma tenuis]